MALFPLACASSASAPLLLETDLEEEEADPLEATALAAAFGAPAALAPHRLGAMPAAAGAEKTAVFACDARAKNFGRCQVSSRAAAQATMPCPGNGDGLNLQVRIQGWCDGLPTTWSHTVLIQERCQWDDAVSWEDRLELLQGGQAI